MFLENFGQDEDGEQARHAFLASGDQLNAEDMDFSDPSALLRRQRLLLQHIEEHKANQRVNFDPLKLLRKTSSSAEVQNEDQAATQQEEEKKVENQRPNKNKSQKGMTWALILCHGGKFIVQVYQDMKCVYSGSDSKYVIRKQSGGRQANTDRRKNIMSSVGSQMRRENERILQDHIDAFMEEAEALLDQCKVIYLHAPGMNRLVFMSKSGPLAKHSHKVRAVQFQNNKANHTEATELSKKLTDVRLIFKLD